MLLQIVCLLQIDKEGISSLIPFYTVSNHNTIQRNCFFSICFIDIQTLANHIK